MSVSGPSPLGTLMVQRVEAALGVTLAQQANVAKGAGPDAVTQPGQPDKTDALKNPPPKEHEGARAPQEQGDRRGGLAALARNNPDIAKLLALRNAPMTSFTASAPTSLGQAAKTILALLQQFPDARPAVTGRAPLLQHAPGQPGGAAGQGGAATGAGGQPTAAPMGGQLDARAIQALMQRAAGEGATQAGQATATGRAAPASGTLTSQSPTPGQPGAAATGNTTGTTPGGALPPLTGMAGQLAQALSQAIQGSGLFYESHLRDLAFGHRTVAQLRAEPQAQAGQQAPTTQTAGESAQARGAAEGTGGTNPAQAASQAANQSAAQATHAAQSAQLTSAHLAGALLGLDPSTHALVRQQLETLANQSFAWQGEAWPGGDLEWEVQRREPQQDDADAPDTWATRLKLNLPGLGEVQARLSLAGGQIVMHLVAPSGADLMADHTNLLREKLDVHGLTLSQLTISRDADDQGGA